MGCFYRRQWPRQGGPGPPRSPEQLGSRVLSGLAAGDRVVLHPSGRIGDGSRIAQREERVGELDRGRQTNSSHGEEGGACLAREKRRRAESLNPSIEATHTFCLSADYCHKSIRW